MHRQGATRAPPGHHSGITRAPPRHLQDSTRAPPPGEREREREREPGSQATTGTQPARHPATPAGRLSLPFLVEMPWECPGGRPWVPWECTRTTWLSPGDALVVVPWWCPGGVLVVPWWDALVVTWWCPGGALAMLWRYSDGSSVVPFSLPLSLPRHHHQGTPRALPGHS